MSKLKPQAYKPLELLRIVQQDLQQFSLNPIPDSWALLSHIASLTKQDLLAAESIAIDKRRLSKYQSSLLKLQQEEPISYITGQAQFLDLNLTVLKGVLIPRPETEGLVLKVQDYLQRVKPQQVQITELGCGSGCITVALCQWLSAKHISFDYTATDISAKAIRNTLLNLDLLTDKDLKIETITGKADTSIIIRDDEEVLRSAKNPSLIDIFVSNPPYLTDNEYRSAPSAVKDFEPKTALAAGTDGMAVYQRIAEILGADAHKPTLFLEISPSTAAACQRLFEKQYSDVTISEDLFGRQRYLTAGTQTL